MIFDIIKIYLIIGSLFGFVLMVKFILLFCGVNFFIKNVKRSKVDLIIEDTKAGMSAFNPIVGSLVAAIAVIVISAIELILWPMTVYRKLNSML